MLDLDSQYSDEFEATTIDLIAGAVLEIDVDLQLHVVLLKIRLGFRIRWITIHLSSSKASAFIAALQRAAEAVDHANDGDYAFRDADNKG